jgi:hypothetical protein
MARRMPFKSKAQRRKFAQLLVEGKISDEVYEEWNRSTGRKELPERLHPPEPGSRKAAKPPKAPKTRKAGKVASRGTRGAKKPAGVSKRASARRPT